MISTKQLENNNEKKNDENELDEEEIEQQYQLKLKEVEELKKRRLKIRELKKENNIIINNKFDFFEKEDKDPYTLLKDCSNDIAYEKIQSSPTVFVFDPFCDNSKKIISEFIKNDPYRPVLVLQLSLCKNFNSISEIVKACIEDLKKWDKKHKCPKFAKGFYFFGYSFFAADLAFQLSEELHKEGVRLLFAGLVDFDLSAYLLAFKSPKESLNIILKSTLKALNLEIDFQFTDNNKIFEQIESIFSKLLDYSENKEVEQKLNELKCNILLMMGGIKKDEKPHSYKEIREMSIFIKKEEKELSLDLSNALALLDMKVFLYTILVALETLKGRLLEKFNEVEIKDELYSLGKMISVYENVIVEFDNGSTKVNKIGFLKNSKKILKNYKFPIDSTENLTEREALAYNFNCIKNLTTGYLSRLKDLFLYYVFDLKEIIEKNKIKMNLVCDLILGFDYKLQHSKQNSSILEQDCDEPYKFGDKHSLMLEQIFISCDNLEKSNNDKFIKN